MYYGATYSTDPESFGEITVIFEVAADWDGYRFHGYCVPTSEELAAAGYDPDADGVYTL
jgi:hypothetical protein